MNSEAKRNSVFIEEDESEVTLLEDEENEIETFSCKYCDFATDDIDILDEHIVSHEEALLEDDDQLDDDEFNQICEESDDPLASPPESPKNSEPKKLSGIDLNFSQEFAENALPWRGRKPKQRLPAFFDEYKNQPTKKVFVCPFCGYQSMKKLDLNKHLKQHTQPVELPIYACAECPYSTRRKCDMSKHLLTHCDNDSVTMYRCDQCPYATKRKGDLAKHTVCHGKPTTLYKCSECTYASKRHGDLKKHLACHDNNVPSIKDGSSYNCTECGYIARRLNDLHKHVVLHCDRAYKSLFKCLKCDYMCAAGSHFAKHVLSNCRTREMVITEFPEQANSENVIFLEEQFYETELDEDYVPPKTTTSAKRKRGRPSSNAAKRILYSADNEMEVTSEGDKVIVVAGYEENEQSEG